MTKSDRNGKKGTNASHKRFDRRTVLAGAGLTATAGIAAATGPRARADTGESWDLETEILVVGSGAAAGSAAVTAAGEGAQVMVVEKMPITGGTTRKSGGVAWICNHFLLRERGIADEKADAMAYMVRFSYPQRYDPNSATLGLAEPDYKLIEAFYDNGSQAIDRLRELNAVQFKQFRMFQVEEDAPDYADHLPENKVPFGRALEPEVGSGGSVGGSSLATQLENWLRQKQVPIMTDTRVTGLIVQDGRVVGAVADTPDKTIRIRAKKAIIFGTGGYAHNLDLIALHQTALYGSCASPGATGDFIPIAGEIGAQMGTLDTAWRTQVVFDESLKNRVQGVCCYYLPGDSMILVNKYGKRAVNEKRDYNDRTRIHFNYNPTHEEFPNHLLFMLFDERSRNIFAGNYPFPKEGGSPWMISGQTWDELFSNIDGRLSQLAAKSGGVTLAADFGKTAKTTIENFNGYARKGVDPEFERGKRAYDTQWHKLFSYAKGGWDPNPNPMPNITMHPFADEGPYHAFILAAGALDTNGGPKINEHAQILHQNGTPIKGLYGAGNCIASPTRAGYYGAGGTIGPALTFGHIAGRHAAGLEPI